MSVVPNSPPPADAGSPAPAPIPTDDDDSPEPTIRDVMTSLRDVMTELASFRTDVNTKFEDVNKKLEDVNKKFEDVNTKLDHHTTILDHHTTQLDRLIQATPAAAIPEVVTKHVVGLDNSTWTFMRMIRGEQDDMFFAVGSAHCAFRGGTEMMEPKKDGLMFIRLPKGVVQCDVKSVYTYGNLSDVVTKWPVGRDIVYVHVENLPNGIKKDELLVIDPDGSYEKGKEQCRSAFSSTVGVSLSSLVNGARCVDFDTLDVQSPPLDENNKFFIFTTGDGAHGEGGNSGTLMFLLNKNNNGKPLALGCFKGFWDGFTTSNKTYYPRMAIAPFPPFQDMQEHEVTVLKPRTGTIKIICDGKVYNDYNFVKKMLTMTSSQANKSIYGVICGGFDKTKIPKAAGGSGLHDFSCWDIFRSCRK